MPDLLAYAEYQKARDEMRELLTAKANIDRLFEKDQDRQQLSAEQHNQQDGL